LTDPGDLSFRAHLIELSAQLASIFGTASTIRSPWHGGRLFRCTRSFALEPRTQRENDHAIEGLYLDIMFADTW